LKKLKKYIKVILQYNLYSDNKNIRIFYNVKNEGGCYTKRRCVKLAEGEICGFLDPDDALLPDALELMTNEHLKNENISLVYSKHIVCDENLVEKYVSLYARTIPKDSDYLHFAQFAISPFASFKKNLYSQTEGINSQLARAVDQDLYLKMEEVGALLFIDKPLYLYRVHKNGISTYDNSIKACFWHLKVIDNTCQRRGIPAESENIAGKGLIKAFVEPPQTEIKILNEKIYNPSLIDVLKCFYRYIRMLFKRILKKLKFIEQRRNRQST
jgi:glycosyltransferase involved in cell wall biosynthesis